VVPGSIFSSNSKGTNKLIHAGATPVATSFEILDALGFELPKDENKQKSLFADLLPEEKIVVSLLREPVPRDELLRAMKLPTPKAMAILSVMEIKEIIKEELGEIKLI
jgi:DNA processing protein